MMSGMEKPPRWTGRWAGWVTGRRWSLALGVAALAAGPLEAQIVTGFVRDAASGAPIEGALVRLLAADGAVVGSSLSDAEGWFALESREPGAYLLEAQRIGYRTSRAGPLSLAPGVDREVELRLSPQAVRLDSMTVTVEARRQRLESAGFYQRKKVGEGVFIERDEIERRRPESVPALLQGRRGVVVMARQGGGLRVVLRGGVSFSLAAEQFCAPRVYVDGMAVDSLDLEREIHPDQLEGVEVYATPATVPPQYGGAYAACGVLLFWTRPGGREAP